MSSPHLSPSASQLARWFGEDYVENVSTQMKDWYGPPIQIIGAPQRQKIFAHKGGDFSGQSPGSRMASLADWAAERTRASVKRWWDGLGKSSMQMAAVASVSDIIAAATAANGRREFAFQKAGSTGVVGICSTLWRSAGKPDAGAVASSAPGGRIPDNTTLGSFPIDNVSTAVRNLVSGNMGCSTLGNSLLMYDRLFEVNKTMSSSATEAVTGSLTRYTSTTVTNQDYCGGNFLFIEVQGALSATAHNWTVCKYTNQAGSTGQTLPSVTGVSSAIINRFDTTLATFYLPLASGDYGISALTQMQCSTASLTGTIAFVIGHPIGFMANSLANCVLATDWVNEEFSLPRIFDSAALGLIECPKPATTATNYWGTFVAVHA